MQRLVRSSVVLLGAALVFFLCTRVEGLDEQRKQGHRRTLKDITGGELWNTLASAFQTSGSSGSSTSNTSSSTATSSSTSASYAGQPRTPTWMTAESAPPTSSSSQQPPPTPYSPGGNPTGGVPFFSGMGYPRGSAFGASSPSNFPQNTGPQQQPPPSPMQQYEPYNFFSG